MKSLHLLVALALVAIGLVACHDDRTESFYPSLADAAKDGAITRGWVPDDLLPASSQNIHEVHDLSPSREWCSFEFAPNDSHKMRVTLKSVNMVPPWFKFVPDPGVKWWPIALSGRLDADTIHRAGLELLMTERPDTPVTNEVLLFALDWSKGHGFFFSTTAPPK